MEKSTRLRFTGGLIPPPGVSGDPATVVPQFCAGAVEPIRIRRLVVSQLTSHRIQTDNVTQISLRDLERSRITPQTSRKRSWMGSGEEKNPDILLLLDFGTERSGWDLE